MEEAVHKRVPESPSVDAVATELVDAPSFIVPAAKYFKHEVDDNSLNKAMIEKRFVKPAEAVEEKKIMIEEGIPTKRTESVRFPSPPTKISNGEEITGKRTVKQRLRKNRNIAIATLVAGRIVASSIVLAAITAPSHPDA